MACYGDSFTFMDRGGTLQHSWLRCYATSRQVAYLSPYEVIDSFFSSVELILSVTPRPWGLFSL
jgi:hypothetical protein